MPAKPRPSVVAEPIVMVPLSTAFCADDADVVIRTKGTLDFRVHKCILSLASPIFKDMFTIPQPPTDTPGVLPHVDVQDPPEAWENILRTIYPMPNPTIGNLDDLESLLLTAKKYEMQFVLDSYKQRFEDQAFIRSDPLRLYAIACAGGFEEQAKYVARHAGCRTVVGRSGVGDLKGLTVDSYHRLVSFLVERDEEWAKISIHAMADPPPCCCPSDSCYETIKRNLTISYLRADEIYAKALEHQFKGCETSWNYCAMSVSRIRNTVDLVVKERDMICDKLIW